MGALTTGLFNVEALEERARNLGSRNGLKRVFVDLPPGPQPPHATVRAEFHNANGLAQIVADVGSNARTAEDIFPLSGGVRLRAGTAPGQVRTVLVATGPDAASLVLRIAPVGDYSTYTLGYVDLAADPLFARIPFKFRPGCFNLNCGPARARVEVPPEHPGLDYLARDYDSFRHILIQAMQQRVPGWEATSEADLDQVLINLLAAEGDLLSDYQDRVMNEAYLTTARKRVSLARHARLMDYHIHQGNQAATWLALRVLVDAVIAKDFGAWTGRRFSDPGSVAFATAAPVEVFTALNEVRGYSWGGALDALEAGSTEADLALPAPLNPNLQSAADGFRDLLRGGKAPRLLIEQALNPETGTVNGRDPTARQVLRLLDGAAAAESVFDPAAGHWLVRARWQPEDALRRRYCLISRCAGSAPVEGITVFRGNLVQAFQGRPRRTTFRPPGADLLTADLDGFLQKDEAHWRPTPYGIACDLTASPLAYRDTPPGGEAQVHSTLEVKVSGFLAPWQERSDLIESDSDAPHFLVDTDEMRASTVCFGNGINGMSPPSESIIECAWQMGQGVAGNVGANALTGFDPAGFAAVEAVWNPFDVTGGREPEPPEEIRRRVPEAYRARQLRAVTLEDYARRAEELPGISAARATYAWTGSWRTVRVALDPVGGIGLPESLRQEAARYLEAVRLIGEDLEVRPARYVALDIRLRVCAGPEYWPEDLRNALENEFSEGYTLDGRQGFFHPDRWTFGQPLHVSQIFGRALKVPGVDRVVRLSMRRWDPGAGGGLSVIVMDEADLPSAPDQVVRPAPDEILRMANDPSRLENGRMVFEILGGRR